MLKWMALFILFSIMARASDTIEPEAQLPQSSPESSDLIRYLELEYKLFSPEMLFQVGDDVVSMEPQSAGQPGVRFSYGDVSFSYNQSRVFETAKSQSGGLDLSYNWKNSYVQIYHAWATGYSVGLNPDKGDKKNLGDRDDMKGSSSGVSFLRAHDESASFSMMNLRGPRDLKSVTAPFQFIYQLVVDKSVFDDSSAFVEGDTLRRIERTSILPGIGWMGSESTPVGYAFVAYTLGLGVVEEKMTHTTGEVITKKDGAYAISALLNLVVQQDVGSFESQDWRWYGGLGGCIQLIQPFDKKLLGQRMFLVSAFVGVGF